MVSELYVWICCTLRCSRIGGAVACAGLQRVPHIPHTWGTGWANSVAALSEAERHALAAYVPFRYVIASDILLYVR